MHEDYTGSPNSLRSRYGSPASAPRMPDLAPNPKYKSPEDAPAPAPKKKVIRKKRTTTTTGSRKAKAPTQSNRQQATMPTRPKKELPRSSVSQPRNHLGQFARKTGAVLWGAAKGTAKAVAGTVRTAQKVHKTVKRTQATARRQRNLKMREQAVAVREREQKLGKRKKVIRRKKR